MKGFRKRERGVLTLVADQGPRRFFSLLPLFFSLAFKDYEQRVILWDGSTDIPSERRSTLLIPSGRGWIAAKRVVALPPLLDHQGWQNVWADLSESLLCAPFHSPFAPDAYAPLSGDIEFLSGSEIRGGG